MKIFRSPWLYTGLFLFVTFFTGWLNRFYRYWDKMLLAPVPDSQMQDDINYKWVDFYMLIFGIFLPIILFFFLTKLVIKRFSTGRA